MENPTLSRRTLLTAGTATLAGLALLNARFVQASPLQADEEVIPWLDQPPESPMPPQVLATQLVWEQVDSWIARIIPARARMLPGAMSLAVFIPDVPKFTAKPHRRQRPAQ